VESEFALIVKGEPPVVAERLEDVPAHPTPPGNLTPQPPD
jgi:hypothetical protein